MKNLRKKAIAAALLVATSVSWNANIDMAIGQDQQTQPTTLQGQQSKQLTLRKERAVLAKPTNTAITDKERADVIIVKFREGTHVRLRSGQLIADVADRSPAEAKLLGRANLYENEVVQDLAVANNLSQRRSGLRFERMFTEPEQMLDSEKQEGESKSGEELADLTLYYFVLIENADPRETEQLIDQLNALDIVEVAYPQPIYELTQVDIAPVTPDFTGRQEYLDAAPKGIDARYAWNLAGGRGEGVRVIDVEFGWNLDHEDIRAPFFRNGHNSNDPEYRQHGTAVLGVIAGAENAYGVTGIAPRAEIGVSSILSSAVSSDTAPAIKTAAAQLRSGDILLIELMMKGPASKETCSENCKQFEFIPVEYSQANFDIIRNATARGIIIVEAAGNGSMNLDASRYERRFDRAFRDSGAILVGAGSSDSRWPQTYSNYGSRVDLQGWGQNVMTLGYGENGYGYPDPSFRVNGDDDDRQWYVRGFGGTSSASPIVVGAVAAIQGIRKARKLPHLTAHYMRAVLRVTGTPQGDTSNMRHQIGPLPNLKAAIPLAMGILPIANDFNGDSISAIARTPAHLDVFWVGSNGAVQTSRWDANVNNGRWNGPLNITEQGKAPPGGAVAALARKPDHLDVFWVDNDGTVQTNWWNANQGWGSSFPITVSNTALPGAAVAAVARKPDHLDVFWVNNTGAVQTSWWDANANNGRWNTLYNIPNSSTALPGGAVMALARKPDHLDVFWVDNDGAVQTNWWNANQGWGSSFPITGDKYAALPGSAVAAVARGAYHLDVFWVNNTGAVQTSWWDANANNGRWNTLYNIPNSSTARAGGAVAALARMPDHLDVFWINTDGAVETNWWNARQGWTPSLYNTITASYAAPPGSTVAAVARGAYHMDVFWVGSNGAVQTNWWDANVRNGRWNTPYNITEGGIAPPR